MTKRKAFDLNRDIPNLVGKVILVTEGNNGLGSRRSASKPPCALLLPPASNDHGHRLDVLINNAGIMCTPGGLTEGGYEVQSVARLTQLLPPTLKRTAAAHGDGGGDVLVVLLSPDLESSVPADTYGKLDELNTAMVATLTRVRCGISKLANVHYAAALAAGSPDLRVVSVMQTSSGRGWKGPWWKGLVRCSGVSSVWRRNFLTPTKKAVHNSLWAATAMSEFYHSVCVGGKGSWLCRDTKQRDALWDWTQKELQPH
ncbi:hypothetical protein MAPG_03440 [Magnaporthiopsis poae ATCC 64411]|uniref:Uncharacterized protein n=1 Tax=Magnaporthiopsis poae (strain ATCC 64411 / 73-15) TaxID=644358 RepID=A0A0C4DU08_MAGP6|nr:hypothetical protein MAPG_03440 [Magnaporthiopsis poae ATCC 64411]